MHTWFECTIKYEKNSGDGKIIQCHGKYNNETEYHKRIISLVNKNIDLIKKKTA